MRASKSEKKFLLYWRAVNGPQLVSEHVFARPRRWRFDFCHPETMVAIEIEGGVWLKSRHTSGAGFTADCEKYNEATHLGWSLFRLTTGMITVSNCERLARFIRSRQGKACQR